MKKAVLVNAMYIVVFVVVIVVRHLAKGLDVLFLS
jgi:hypothetical protein